MEILLLFVYMLSVKLLKIIYNVFQDDDEGIW